MKVNMDKEYFVDQHIAAGVYNNALKETYDLLFPNNRLENIWAILTSYNIYMLLRVFKGVFGDALISRRLKLHS